MKKILVYILLVFITAILLIKPDDAIFYAKNSLAMCSQIIIPSLFPFFVCSGLLIYSGFCEVLAKISKPIMKPLFNINPTGAAAFILGIISGYPLGALTTCQLYSASYLSKHEAQRLLAFCNNSGPLFILGSIGVCMYHSTKAGVILYISHILSALTVGIIFRFYKKDSYSAPESKITTNQNKMSDIFSTVMTNSVYSILTICGTVVFCSICVNLFLDMVNINETYKAILNSLLEFTSGLKKVSLLDISLSNKLLLSAAICSFAGMSVHLQVLGIVTKTDLSLKPYFIGKVLHAVFCVVYTYIAITLTPEFTPAFSCVSNSQKMGAGFFISSLFCVIFIIILILICTVFKIKNMYTLNRKKII